MIVRYAKAFKKQYRKLLLPIRQQFKVRLRLWQTDPASPQLRVHSLAGQYLGCWSFNVTGDVRALYRFEGDEVVLFLLIGTHSQLYG